MRFPYGATISWMGFCSYYIAIIALFEFHCGGSFPLGIQLKFKFLLKMHSLRATVAEEQGEWIEN